MVASALSIMVGALMALAYEFFALRSQVRFARNPGAAQGIRFAGEMVLRFAWVGVVLTAAQRWTPLDVVVMAVSFVGGFVALQGVSLYRYAKGSGPFAREGTETPSSKSEFERRSGTPGEEPCRVQGVAC